MGEPPPVAKPLPEPAKPIINFRYKWKRIFGAQWTPPIWYRRETIPATHEATGIKSAVVIHKFWFLGLFHCVLTTIREVHLDQE
ncbi:MAG: hypothetical protein B7Z37_03035 [Verrucomicrobia bacterium 12-59-8]|nr:MAG: hypothetical protein B7Z37_03035 [Verrucomicrobia bacterium 12-59-8]